jgi:hypothetical protein
MVFRKAADFLDKIHATKQEVKKGIFACLPRTFLSFAKALEGEISGTRGCHGDRGRDLGHQGETKPQHWRNFFLRHVACVSLRRNSVLR